MIQSVVKKLPLLSDGATPGAGAAREEKMQDLEPWRCEGM